MPITREIIRSTARILSIPDARPFKTLELSAERDTNILPKNVQRPRNIHSIPLSTGVGISVIMFITEQTEMKIAISKIVNMEPFIIPFI